MCTEPQGWLDVRQEMAVIKYNSGIVQQEHGIIVPGNVMSGHHKLIIVRKTLKKCKIYNVFLVPAQK